MNTIRSTWYGWGALFVAGGGAYYFAKRSINADRKTRHEADMKRRRLAQSLEFNSKQSSEQENRHRKADHEGIPSTEASHDPAPTKHASESGGQNAQGNSKYVASEPFRAKKGDRFS